MEFLLPLAAKSLLVAGATLLLLRLMQKRSSSDRSWIAHLGLAALLLLPAGSLALPQLEIAGPGFLAGDPVEPAIVKSPVAAAPLSPDAAFAPEVAAQAKPFPAPVQRTARESVDWGFWAYAAPAALLLLLTLIAFGRLIALKSRAEVLVDSHWLKALAEAQRRMGFKSGTALLTSNDLTSPVSWGLIRPVILLNTDAAKARSEAEAIIAHELAHVARLDWAKLMLSRVAVALYWFNPLVWLLAREAHQLREETADDAVLAADIEDTEYANLLVGIARHECRGLLLGAHGVAPARNSLARRVKRVLDAASVRAPGGWRWGTAAAFFAAGMVVPVAALQIVNPTIAGAREVGRFGAPHAVASAAPPATQAAIADPETGIAAVAATASTIAAPASSVAGAVVQPPNGGRIEAKANGELVMVGPSGGTIRVLAPDRDGIRRAILTAPGGSVIEVADARSVPGLTVPKVVVPTRSPPSAANRAIELKAVGATPQYVRSMRAAAPDLPLSHDDIVELRTVGVSPDYVRGLVRSGYAGLDVDGIVQARAMGIDGAYIGGMVAAGYGRLSMDQMVELKAVGVTPRDVVRYRRVTGKLPSVDNIVQAKSVGVNPEDIDPEDNP